MLWYWLYLVVALHCVSACAASGHAVLTKRDVRAALGWVGVSWLAPLLGVALYFWLGINRIERRARMLRTHHRSAASAPRHRCGNASHDPSLPLPGEHLKHLASLVGQVSDRPLLPGNRVQPLINGDQAYPAMIRAIDEALQSITLTAYIFRSDATGRQFLESLRDAVRRGVEVRVLVDDVGARCSWPSMPGLLRANGIRCARFLPTMVPWKFRYSNLRSHRKILVVDGKIGFTGGINIDRRNCLQQDGSAHIQDLHFQCEGPIVSQFQEVFADDWAFAAGELLDGAAWFPIVEGDGPVLARGVSSGPDADFDTLRVVFLGALACARSSVHIVTPYFLPDQSLIDALNVTALRGVEVDIVLPASSDLALVQWASFPLLRQLLERGCRIWHSPPPFDHSKLMLVDGLWTFLGSANWDPRSFRLNFEFNAECYDERLGKCLTALVEAKKTSSRKLSLADLESRHLGARLRDGVAGLLSPYL